MVLLEYSQKPTVECGESIMSCNVNDSEKRYCKWKINLMFYCLVLDFAPCPISSAFRPEASLDFMTALYYPVVLIMEIDMAMND